MERGSEAEAELESPEPDLPERDELSELLPEPRPRSTGLLRREISPVAPLGELVLVLCWAALSAFVFTEVSGSTSSLVPELFTGLGGTVVLVVILYRRAADRRIRQGLRDASVALQAIEAVTDPALSFLALDELLDEVLARTRLILHGDVASVLLLGEDGSSVVVRASHGESGLMVAPPETADEEGVIAQVTRQRRGVIVNDVSDSSPPRAMSRQRISSLVAAPLLVRGEAIGAVEVATRRRHRFEKRDLRLLQVVADRCAASIERARLDDAERRGRLGAGHARLHLALLGRASDCLSMATDSYEDSLDALVDVVVPDFADWFCADIVDDSGELHRVAYGPRGTEAAVRSGSALFPHRHPQGDQLVRRAIADGRPQVVMPAKRSGSPHGGEPAASGEFGEARPAAGIESMVVVPVKVRGSSRGALSFVTGSGRRGYRRSDLETAEGLAERVGVTVERVEAWRQATRHAERLQRLMEAALVVNAPLAEPEVLDLLAEHAYRALDITSVFLCDVGTDGARTEKQWPSAPDEPAEDELIDDVLRASSAVAEVSRPQRSPQGSTDPAMTRTRDGEGAISWLGVPLDGAKGANRRVIVVIGQPGTAFSDEDEWALTLLAQMAGVALQNAELYKSVQGNEHRLRAVVDSSPLAIAELDLSGEARWWNRAATEYFGWAAEGSGQQRLPVLGTAQAVTENLWSRTRGGEATLDTEVTATAPDGRQLELAISTAPLLDLQGQVTGILMVAGDITERRKLMDQFHQAERLSAMTRMAGGLAHDFNNLLTVILGCSEALMRRLGHEPAVQEEAGAIKRASQRAAALTSQLLSIGHRRALQPVVVDVNEFVLSMQPMLTGVLGQNIDLDVLLCPEPAAIFIDLAELERAVLNLAINARDAMPQGGRLAVQVEASGNGGSTAPSKLIGLSVSDTGVGMDADAKEHCLEPFFSTKGLAHGTGLGLSTVHAMVTHAGGQTSVESAPGAGTTVTLWLPASGDRTVASPAGDQVLASNSGNEAILLVEDEPELRRLADSELSARGYSVRVAANATEAFRIAQENLGWFDLVVTDVVMPGMSGVDMAQLILRIDPDLPVLFVSGHVEDDLLSHSPIEGSELLAKPFTPEQLATRVREMLDRPSTRRRAGPI